MLKYLKINIFFASLVKIYVYSANCRGIITKYFKLNEKKTKAKRTKRYKTLAFSGVL